MLIWLVGVSHICSTVSSSFLFACNSHEMGRIVWVHFGLLSVNDINVVEGGEWWGCKICFKEKCLKFVLQ